MDMSPKKRAKLCSLSTEDSSASRSADATAGNETKKPGRFNTSDKTEGENIHQGTPLLMDEMANSAAVDETEKPGSDCTPSQMEKDSVHKGTQLPTDETMISGDDDMELGDDEPQEDEDDPFAHHFETEITDELVQNIQKKVTENVPSMWPILKNMRVTKYTGAPQIPAGPLGLDSIHMKPEIMVNIPAAQTVCQRVKETQHKSNDLSSLQLELLSIIGHYRDLLFTERSFSNGEEVRLAYCLHALNHILKTRSRVVHHNRKLTKKTESAPDYRDQGFARPKVLILLPFKEAALRVVNLLTILLSSDRKGNVLNKKRFKLDFATCEEVPESKYNQRPDDFKAMFAGNIEDSFRLGITITRRSMKLYADFYSSDIIIASPLGLRTVIGAEGEKERDYDFLASIEVLIFDQTDVFLMQNWEHLLHILQHLHLQPTQARNTDFSRVRMWTLNGLSKHYRQTILFSSISHPLINALFSRNCSNFAGCFQTLNPPQLTSLNQVLLQVPQVFHRFDPESLETLHEVRLKHFLSKVLVHFKDPVMSHTMIYIPSYFDYVRLRNHFRKEDMSFTQICEYSKEGKVARARDMFFHGQKHFLLFTERFHFFHRYMIKGVRHLVFYELPTYPHFYSELVNLLHPRFQAKQRPTDNCSVAVLYSRCEAPQLSAVVGKDRAAKMLSSKKKLHMFVTER